MDQLRDLNNFSSSNYKLFNFVEMVINLGLKRPKKNQIIHMNETKIIEMCKQQKKFYQILSKK